MTQPRERELPPWRRYLRFWRANVGADVDEEIRFHLDARTRDLVNEGTAPASAHAEALRRFGSVERVARECRRIGDQWERDMRRTEWIDSFRQDLVFAFRQLRRSPVLAGVAALTLALGIGANTAIFSVVHAVLLAPLPFADADRLTLVFERWRDQDGSVSLGALDDMQRESRAFEAVGAMQSVSVNLASPGGEPERVFGARVTPGFFRVLQTPPVAGRYFLDAEGLPGGAKTVVLSTRLWERRFARDSAILGREIMISGAPHQVVGIAPKAFAYGPADNDLFVPLVMPGAFGRKEFDEHFLLVFAKLKSGTTLDAANADARRVMEISRQRFPDVLGERSAHVLPLHERVIRDARRQLLVLLGAVGFVLLIACVNVANLLLARATTRRKEIAIRTALGAGRGRLVRQLLTESLALAVSGGLLGLLIAHQGIRFLVTTAPRGIPRLDTAGLHPAVVAVAIALTVVSGVLFGLAPALRAARPNVQATLREGGRGSSSGGGSGRDPLRGALVVAEVATALLLLVGAGLMVRSAIALQRVNPGFDPANLLTMRTALTAGGYPEAPRVVLAFQQIHDAVRRVSGVQAAALASQAPLGGGTQNGLLPEGRPNSFESLINSTMRIVTPDYHETMRVAVRHGRAFTATDDAHSPRVMIINETLARLAFPGQDPIGKRISCCDGGPNRPSWKEVVGVAADVRAWGIGLDVQPEFYLPLAQAPVPAWDWIQRSMAILVRSSANDPAALTSSVRRAVSSVDPTLPLYRIQTMAETLQQSTAGTRFNMLLLTLLGVTGAVLAAVGIYGVIAYFVSQRVHEIGVRIALGASRPQVLRLVVGHGVRLGLVGIAIGLIAAVGLTRLLDTLLFGVKPIDAVTYGAVGLLVAAVAVVASYLPARRATRVDPVTALRET